MSCNFDYKRMFESSTEGMLIAEADGDQPGRVLDANIEACRMIGMEHNNLTSTKVDQIFGASDPRVALAFEELQRTGRYRGELCLQLQNGKSLTTQTLITALSETQFGLILQNVSEQKSTQEETQRLNEDLKLQVAQDAEQLKAVMSEVDDYETLLGENVEKLRSVFEQTATGMAQASSEGRFCWVNSKLCEMVGYRPEELSRMTLYDLTHPQDRYAIREHVRRLLSGETSTEQLERRLLCKDGLIARVKLTVSPIRNSPRTPKHFIAVVEDVGGVRRTEEALLQSRKLYQTVVEQAAENIFLVDAETRRILQANAAFCRSLGYTVEDLERGLLYDLVAHDDLVAHNRESVDQGIQRILKEGRAYLGERGYRRKDGRIVDFEVNVSTVFHEGRNVLCVVAHDITERKRVEKNLRRSLDTLLALREAGQILGSTLDSEEIAIALLEIMRGIFGLSTVIIDVEDGDRNLGIWHSTGLEMLWPKARYAPAAQEARRAALNTGAHRLFQLRRPGPEGEKIEGLCLPLNVRNEAIGVLEAYGPRNLAEDEAAGILASLANQAASALENARLYGELAEREKQLETLVQRLLTAQEKERRQVAFEVHDGLAQMAAATHQHLQAFARFYASDLQEGQEILKEALRLGHKTAGEARRVIANLRPTTLDDFGLKTALNLEAEGLSREGWSIEFAGNVREGERLPPGIETILFRIAQEALTNVRKHANTMRVRVRLDRTEKNVTLAVLDWGQGFNAKSLFASESLGEKVGISSMRERANLFGGKFEIRNQPGAGTLVTARIPLSELSKHVTGMENPPTGERSTGW